jgi:hypothetical protein
MAVDIQPSLAGSIFDTLFQDEISIRRPTAGQGEVSEFGEWVTSTSINTITMKGNVQPYINTDVSKGQASIPTKDGFNDSQARTVFTDQLTRPVDSYSDQEPDETTIDGEVYVCWRVINNLNSPLEHLRHCESVFLRRAFLGG